MLNVIDLLSPDYFNKERVENRVEKILEVKKNISEQNDVAGVLSLTIKFLWFK